jgi:beta-glucosidase
VLELLGFRRVRLEAGERRTVAFELGAEQFAYTAADLRRVVEPGRVTFLAGTSSADLPLRATVELVGPTVEVVDRSRYLTVTRVE